MSFGHSSVDDRGPFTPRVFWARMADENPGAEDAGGFTLIELLVVIAILALLAALLFPALSRARQNTRDMVCLGNLKQLTTAYLSYQQDYGSGICYNNAKSIWMSTLFDYQARVAAVRLCPAASSRGSLPLGQYEGNATAPWNWRWNANSNLNSGSYALNGWLYTLTGAEGQEPRQAELGFVREGLIVRPSVTPVFMDAIWPDTWPDTDSIPPTNLWCGSGTSPLGRICVARHPLVPNASVEPGQPLPGGINMSYADGHVARLPLQDLKTVMWHRKSLGNTNPWATSASPDCFPF